MRRLSRRRALVTAICAAAVAVGAWLWLGRDHVSPVTTQEAVERLRREQPGPAASPFVDGARAPRSGVYEYRTDGGERFQSYLSASHAYPARTTISVSRGGCGVLVRWTPLEQRQTERELCPAAGGWRLRSILDIHEFFGRRDERRYVCERGVVFRLGGDWSYGCRYESSTNAFAGRFVGIETLDVGGHPVVTVHVHERNVVRGPEQGEGESESWYRRFDGLLVSRTAAYRARAPVPGGSGTYSERYELRLLALRPRL